METRNGLHLQVIVAGLVLALSMNPLAYAANQEPAPSQSGDALPDSPGAIRNQPVPQTQPAPASAHPSVPSNSPAPAPASEVQPVPPMPPLTAAEQLAQATEQEQDSTLQDLSSAESKSEPQSAQAVPPMPPAAQEQKPAPPKEALGTAAAETVPTVGVAASRPAGAALAPAKQRRVRILLVRMGAILGVSAAVGVTMALSEASPSKPPGTH